MQPSSPILIVEDSETQAMRLCHLLEEEGWDVVRAASAESALEKLNRYRPRLIIADYHLPGMRGDELCRRIRMNVRTRNIPILMLTVEDDGFNEQAGLDSGADNFLDKGVSPDLLLLRVRTMVDAAPEPEDDGLSRPHAQDPYMRRARLLAIDDSPTYLESLTTTLREEGYEVWKTNGGREGLDRISRENFDCVVVDLIMPGIDGIEVCRRISEGKTYAPAMILMLTSSDDKDDVTRGLQAGADDFVAKSSDMTVLKARIRALLRRKFLQEEHRRMVEELKNKELEASEARAARDLSETKAALVEELQRKNNELEAFSYSVSHDLRAPLRSIDGFSQALLEEYSVHLDEKGQNYLRRVRAAARRMGELIDDLLQLSKVGRTELRRERGDLAELARRVFGSLESAFPERQVQMVIPDEVIAEADMRLFLVVFENLLGNAWKFTANIASPVVEFGVTERDGAPAYYVRDNGVGFDMAYAEKLFRPFQRLHPESKFPGTGIGLATVHRIVDRHGGRIWAESTVNGGATFLWTIPAGGSRI